ncbi:N-6 DNA methylase [Burkholderia gladioli]|uniref:site-specific DNA-methyltransferase (adenine-specific) n=1 Tax=Burkholderia gladioli (strain BSR3) TaxID=999541 RepID=F2LTE2_BURGS|nr:N-6 DNA methylase [Burkholderia gladioli]AEA66088.1 N-6 DNA methylase [Burkholderia gladioli BSR3]MBW5287586.1 N-6 DNA methylase [Burkholderia gladioli]
MLDLQRKQAIRHALQRALGILAESGFVSYAGDYTFAMLFLKCISEGALQSSTVLTIPDASRFESLYTSRFQAGQQGHVDEALALLEAANPTLGGVFEQIRFGSSGLGNEYADRLIRRLIEEFADDALCFRGTAADVAPCVDFACDTLIDLAFEARRRSDDSFTPTEIAGVVSRIVSPVQGETVCDPCCGVGTFLVACQRRVDGDLGLFGQEMDGRTWAIAKMNLFMRGQLEQQIEWGDTLRYPRLLDSEGKLRKFDVVVSMPPLGARAWGQEEAIYDHYGRYRRGIPPRFSPEFAFISHMVETLDPLHGRLAVVVPFGVLFRGAAEKQIRERLLRENLVDAVIALPPRLLGHTSIPLAIMVLRTGRAVSDVFFIDAGRAYEAGKTRNVLTEQHIERIEHTYRERQDVPRFARKVSIEEIFSHETSLNVARYVDVTEVEAPVNLAALNEERQFLIEELTELEARMSVLLSRTGPP